MDENTIIYLGLSLLIAIIVISSGSKMGSVGIVIVALAFLTIILILMLSFADFIIVPLATRLFNISIVPAKNFIIPSAQDAVIKYSNGIYYATGYMTANIYNYIFAQEQEIDEQTELTMAPDKWEKAIMNIHFPFKFNIVSASEDIQRYRDELEGKRGLLEFQYSKETQSSNPNSMGLENMQRQINVIQTRIDKIGEGEKPVNSIMYVESTAVGVSQKEASDALANQLSELQTIFNVFDLNLTRVIGRELYQLFKFNYLIPGLSELTSTFDVQK